MWRLPNISLTSFPSLPSLPSISLPEHIQRRFISFLLRRSLGRFIKPGSLNFENIDAEIRNGHIQLDILDLDEEALTGYLPRGYGLRCTGGKVEGCLIRLPLPNLWTAPFSVTVGSVLIELELEDLVVGTNLEAEVERESVDMEASLLDVSQAFVRTDLPPSERHHIHIQTSQVDLDPFATEPADSDDPIAPGGFPSKPFHNQTHMHTDTDEPSSLFASILDGLLGRLKVEVGEVRVRFKHVQRGDSERKEPDRDVRYELRLGGMGYRTEVDSGAHTGQRGGSKTEKSDAAAGYASRVAQIIFIKDVSGWMSVTPSASIRQRSLIRARVPARNRRRSEASTSSTASYAPTPTRRLSPRPPSLRSSSRTGLQDSHSSGSTASPTHPTGVPSSPGNRGTASSSYGSSDEEDGMDLDDMMMSCGIADLRESMIGFPARTGGQDSQSEEEEAADDTEGEEGAESMYESALEQRGTSGEEKYGTQSHSFTRTVHDSEQPRSPAGVAPSPLKSPDSALDQAPLDLRRIFTFGDDGLVLRSTIHREMGRKSQTSEIVAGGISLDIHREDLFALLDTGNRLAQRGVEQSGEKPHTADKVTSRGDRSFEAKVRELSTSIRYGVTKEKDFSSSGQAGRMVLMVAEIAASQSLGTGGWNSKAYMGDANLREVCAGVVTEIMGFDSDISEQDAGAATGNPPAEADLRGWKDRINFPRTGGGGPRAVGREETLSERVNRDLTIKPAVVITTTATGANVTAGPVKLTLETKVIERVLPFAQAVSARVEVYGKSSPHSAERSGTSTQAKPLNIRLRMVRLALVAPPIPGCPGHSRGGNIVTDLYAIVIHAPTEKASDGPDAQEGARRISLDRVIVFHESPASSLAHSVIVLNGKTPIETHETPIPICITLPTSSATETLAAPSLNIPSVQIFLDRPAAEGLQYLANDLASWLDGQLHASDSSPRRDLKMIGSRFFAPISSLDADSSSSSETEELYGLIGSIAVKEVRCYLLLDPVEEQDAESRVISLAAGTLVATARTAPDIQGIGAEVSLQDVRILEQDINRVHNIAWNDRAGPEALPARPCIRVSLSSKTSVSPQIKEASTRVDLADLALFLDPTSPRWALLRRLLKPPKGIFQDMVPSDVTVFHLASQHCIVYSVDGRSGPVLGLATEDGSIRVRLIADAMETIVRAELTTGAIRVIDSSGQGLMDKLANGQTWGHLGGLEPVQLRGSRLLVKQNKLTSSIDVEVTGGQADVVIAADSRTTWLQAGGKIIQAWAKDSSGKEITGSSPEITTHRDAVVAAVERDGSFNMLQSLDEEAFARREAQMKPDLGRSDLLDDDVPHDAKFLDSGSLSGRTATFAHRKSTSTSPDISDIEDDCKIDIMDSSPFVLWTDHFASLEDAAQKAISAHGRTTFHLRVTSLDVSFHFFDGYDWAATRIRIEAEVKAMRRNLLKLRQALAAGQKAQLPSEAVESYLYESILIGLPEDTDLDERENALQAIDEELELLGDSPSGRTSGAPPSSTSEAFGRPNARRAGLHRNLQRSSKQQIEWIFKDVVLDMASYQPGNLRSARTHFGCEDMQIIDHIRTSTWKSFLTEWRPDRHKSKREANARFLRVELVDIAQPGSEDAESRLRIKVIPLRFHIDQDAVSFLNRFFSFNGEEPGSSNVDAKPAATSRGRFFQHVEIFPVEIKLDYKPKRVNVKALSKGKLAELLNLFHFEGSKMVLRHVTLNGISGWGKVYGNLCDVWAPDITANQLSDVASGVAPIRSVINMGTGTADLILLPISQYKRSGVLGRGLQKATGRLAKHTVSETLNAGLQLATGTQIILEKASTALGASFDDPVEAETMEDSMVLTRHDGEDRRLRSRYANQPENAAQGMVAAYQSLARNFSSAAQTILAVPMEVYESSGDQSPAKMVVRAVPIAMLKTMIGVTDASRQAMFGLKNEFRQGVKAEMDEKYKDNVRK